MTNIGERREAAPAPTMKQLLSKATLVSIIYATDAQDIPERREHFELSGEGTTELIELIQRFGERGINAFNQAFLNPDFEKNVMSETRRLTLTRNAMGDASDVEYGNLVNWEISARNKLGSRIL